MDLTVRSPPDSTSGCRSYYSTAADWAVDLDFDLELNDLGTGFEGKSDGGEGVWLVRSSKRGRANGSHCCQMSWSNAEIGRQGNGGNLTTLAGDVGCWREDDCCVPVGGGLAA